jgi:hypothetical protein
MLGAGLLDHRLFSNPVDRGRFDLDPWRPPWCPSGTGCSRLPAWPPCTTGTFIHVGGRRMETPQAFWMRVAMGLSVLEDDPTARAVQFYEQFSRLRYCPSTPTLFNVGTAHPQSASCFLSTAEDSLDGIFGSVIHGQSRLAKWAGGLAVDFTPLRGLGAHIKGTNGPSQGVIPWMKSFNAMLVGVNQGSRRKGTGVAYLETWHIDVLDFLDLRKNTGDERRRCHDMNTAHWIPDLFMERAEANADLDPLQPRRGARPARAVGGGVPVQVRALRAEADAGRVKVWKRVKAKDLAQEDVHGPVRDRPPLVRASRTRATYATPTRRAGSYTRPTFVASRGTSGWLLNVAFGGLTTCVGTAVRSLPRADRRW